MTTVAHNVVAKLAVAFVAVAMLFTMVTPAKAATAEEMQQMINDLLAQVAALQASSGGSTSGAAMCPYTWTRTLKSGVSGADVMKLQQFLNSDADTRVAASGVGSAGMETEYYGPATAAAVSKFQVKYRADVLSPSGLVNPTGYFGPATMAKANKLCVAAPVADDEDEEVADDEEADDEESTELSGEADLTTMEVADGEDADDVEEGSEDVLVAEFTYEFSDGDAIISRIDLALAVDAGNDGDDDPWDVFQDVSLWVDGDEVARKDVTDEDDYLDEDNGSLRFSGLDIVAMEDEEVTVVVAATISSSLDGISNGEAWNIAAGPVRFVDADDVTSTETFGDAQAMDGTYTTNLAEFTINEAGAGDDLNVESSDEDPDASTIALDEDDNVEAMIFAFDISAEDSDGDIELNEVTVVATATVASNMDDLVNDFRLEIDGESFDAESYTGTGGTVTLTFDIDGDVTVAADEKVTATLYADFEDMESNDEGSTIVARVTAVDAEGVRSGEEVDADGLPVESETHTLRTEGIDVAVTDDSATANSIDGSDNDYGEFEMEVDVTAFGEDLYIANTGAGAFTFRIENSAGNEVATGTATSSTISSDADIENGYYRIDEGETESFTLRVTFDPLAANEGQDYRVQFLTIVYNDTADTVSPSTETLTPASEFETGFARISD